MKKVENMIQVAALRFPVSVEDENGSKHIIQVILTKEQLQAAQIVHQSSKELITRICKRHGLGVISIGKAERKTIPVDLGKLWEV